MVLDLLVVAAHPDDAELGAGGLLLRMKALGYKTGILDLTHGELGSRGTPDIRAEEAQASAGRLGVDVRRRLDLGDGRLAPDLERRHAVARVIRELRPTFLVGPYWEDLHPDHAAAGKIVRYASFDARLPKLDLGLPPHSCRRIFFYPCHLNGNPSFVVDITPFFEAKMAAVAEYKSQFGEGVIIPGYINIGTSDYIFSVESRSRFVGSLIGVRFGEGFVADTPPPMPDPYLFWPNPAGRDAV